MEGVIKDGGSERFIRTSRMRIIAQQFIDPDHNRPCSHHPDKKPIHPDKSREKASGDYSSDDRVKGRIHM
jgi:hypothetical protein